MLDPQAQALIDLIAERGLPPTHTLSPPDARAFYRERRTFSQPAPRAMADVLDLAAPGRWARSRCGCTDRLACPARRPRWCTSTAAAG